MYTLKKMEKEELKYNVFRDCFKQLSPDCQQLIGLHFKGMNTKAIGRKLNLPPNNVDQKMYACRESLRNKCKKHPLFKYIKSILL